MPTTNPTAISQPACQSAPGGFAFVVNAIATLTFAVLILAPPQAAGAAPSSQERRIVAGVHADAVSVFFETNRLVLASKADVDDSFGVRLNPHFTLFNVEEITRTPVPNLPSYSFLGAAGSDVWIAPETNPGGTALWPGFNTESVPLGVLGGNQVRIRLELVAGPGALHIYQSDSFGEPVRRLSSTGTDYREWTVPIPTHVHANWAFTATGGYTLTFSAAATTNGVSISATQNYYFVVGDVPPVVPTITTLTASTNQIVQGSPVSFFATVAPTNVVGWVEFRDGVLVLGHDALANGSATLATTNLMVGSRSVTARFVPQWLNDFTASTSAPVAIAVTGSSGVPFSIAGIASSYRPGQTLTGTVVGVTLQGGQTFRWQMRPVGSTGEGANVISSTTSSNYTRVLSAADNNYEIRVLHRSGAGTLAETAWVPIVVSNTGVPLTLTWTNSNPAYLGDDLRATIAGRSLKPGETLRVVERTTGLWTPAAQVTITNNAAIARPTSSWSGESALQVLSNGVVVAQSAAAPFDWRSREVVLSGLQSVYRVGQTAQVSAAVSPMREGLRYDWILFNPSSFQSRTVASGTNAAALSLTLPMDMSHNNNTLTLVAWWPYPNGTTINAGQATAALQVSNSDPSTQVLAFAGLGGHYHQGSPIRLRLIADPMPAANDSIFWEWRWPGGDWTSYPNAARFTNSLVAEQAIDGLQVRATLTFAHTNSSMLAGPVTIDVDDHGAPPQHQLAVTGPSSVVAGRTLTLTGTVSHVRVLSTWQWQRRPAGASTYSVIPGATSARLTFNATLADDGAQYRVALVKPTGQIAYGPSTAMALDVTGSDLSVVRSGGSVTVTVATENGFTYQLETAPAVTGPWTSFGEAFAGTAQAISINVPTSGEAGFFRWQRFAAP